jgi:hypothetical protein
VVTSRCFFVESNSFEFICEEGVSILRVYEKSRGFVRLVSLGKVSVLWLMVTRALLQVEHSKYFVKSSRVGIKAFIAQCGLNHFGRFLAIAEYRGDSSLRSSRKVEEVVAGRVSLSSCLGSLMLSSRPMMEVEG